MVQKRELAAARAADYTFAELVDFPSVRYEQLDGEAEVWPGVRIIPTPGHTDGHQTLVVRQPDGTVIPAEDVLGWYQLARQYYRRYRKPLMHTETNVFDKQAAPAWLWKQWINVLRLRGDGIPVLGFTWYSLVDQIDWERASLDSASIPAKRGAQKPERILRIKERRAPSATLFRTERASHWR